MRQTILGILALAAAAFFAYGGWVGRQRGEPDVWPFVVAAGIFVLAALYIFAARDEQPLWLRRIEGLVALALVAGAVYRYVDERGLSIGRTPYDHGRALGVVVLGLVFGIFGLRRLR